MKRIGNEAFIEICSWNNIEQAYEEAKKGKSSYREVKWVEANRATCLARIKGMLELGEYTVGGYTKIERVEGGKLRQISKLPFFPDRIVHHAILRVIGPTLRKTYIRDTFQSIPNRGTADARKRVQGFIKKNTPKYFLQLDIKKYYPSVDHAGLKKVLRAQIKSKGILHLLDTIIDSHEGLPIGNYTSQDLGNLNLTPFDWYVKQTLGVKGYFRYCDDLVLFGETVEELEAHRDAIMVYMRSLSLTIKETYTLAPLTTGLDFIGYVFYPTGISLRRSIYEAAELALTDKRKRSMAAYYGWLKPTKYNLLKVKYENVFKRTKATNRACR